MAGGGGVCCRGRESLWNWANSQSWSCPEKPPPPSLTQTLCLCPEQKARRQVNHTLYKWHPDPTLPALPWGLTVEVLRAQQDSPAGGEVTHPRALWETCSVLAPDLSLGC